MNARRTFPLAASALVASCGSAGPLPADARGVVDRFVTAIDEQRLDEALAAADAEFRAEATPVAMRPVLESRAAVLGRRVRNEEPEVTRSDDGGARLTIEIPRAHERGEATLGLVAVRGADGRWLVTRCAERSATFTWVLR